MRRWFGGWVQGAPFRRAGLESPPKVSWEAGNRVAIALNGRVRMVQWLLQNSGSVNERLRLV